MTATAGEWATRASLAFLALMIVVPPLNPFHLVPLPAFIEESLAFAFGLGAVVLGIWRRGLRFDRLPRVAPWLVGFIAVLAAQMAWRDLPYREQALIPALYVLWAIALAWLGFVLRDQFGAERTTRVLACCVLAVACVSACMALVQVFELNTPVNWLISRPQSERAYGNLNQPNLLANLLALGIVSAIFLYCSGIFTSPAACAAVVLLAMAMALTGSRVGFVFAGWTVAWAVGWSRTFAGDASRKAMRLALFFAAVFLAFQLVFMILGVSAQSVPATRAMGLTFAEEGPVSPSVRRYIWSQALHMFSLSPLSGVGPGMFGWNFFMNASEFEGLRVHGGERLAHNLVLQLLAETGLIGAALVVVPLALWLGSNRRPQAEPWRWWCVAFAGVGILHSLVENPFWYAHFLGPFALVLGLGDRAAYLVKRQRVLQIVVPALILVGAVSLANAAIGYRQTLAWLHGSAPSAAGASRDAVEKGATLAVMGRSILRPYAELLASSVSMPPERFDPDDVALSERLVRFMPIDVAVYRHIRLLAQAGRGEEARSLLEHAVIAYPHTVHELERELETASPSRGVRDLLRLLKQGPRKTEGSPVPRQSGIAH